MDVHNFLFVPVNAFSLGLAASLLSRATRDYCSPLPGPAHVLCLDHVFFENSSLCTDPIRRLIA